MRLFNNYINGPCTYCKVCTHDYIVTLFLNLTSSISEIRFLDTVLRFVYFLPKFSPSSRVSGSLQFIVSGNNKHNNAPTNGPTPNITGGNQG